MSVILEKYNVNPLYFFTAAKWYDHLRAYAYGQIKPVLCPAGTIPPFQVIKYDGWGIADVQLVSFDTKAETDIKSAMNLSGFEFVDYQTAKGYSILRYPGTVPLPSIATNEGLYYLRLQDYNGTYILSELFSFIDDIDQRRDIIRVDWWHQEAFEYGCTMNSDGDEQATGHIAYDYPFKYWAYVKSDIAKPSYRFENRVVTRKGKTFPLEQIRFKDHRFTFFATESFADAFTLVPLHDQVRITHMGRVYDPDEVLVEIEPSTNGDVFAVKVEFHTDSIAIVNGRAYTSLAYAEDSGTCLTVTECVAIITSGSAEYTGEYWTDTGGSTHPFKNGDYVLIDTTGIITVKLFNGSTYVSAGASDYDNFYTENDSRTSQVATGDYYYFLYSGTLLDAPQLLTYGIVSTTATVTGRSFGDSIVQIILKDENGSEWIGATVTDAEFLSPGADFEIVKQGRTATAYKARAASYVCGTISESDWQEITGVNFDDIGGTLDVYTDTGDTAPNPFDNVDNN